MKTTKPSPEAVKHAHETVEAQLALVKCPGWMWALEQMEAMRNEANHDCKYAATAAEREEARVSAITLERLVQEFEDKLRHALGVLMEHAPGFEVPVEFRDRLAADQAPPRGVKIPAASMNGAFERLVSHYKNQLPPFPTRL